MTHQHTVGDGCPFHGDPPRVDEVLTARQLAGLLDVTDTTVRGWIERSAQTGFPASSEAYGRTPVYAIVEVTAWHQRWRSTRGQGASTQDLVPTPRVPGARGVQLREAERTARPDGGADRSHLELVGSTPEQPREGDQPLPVRNANIGIQTLVLHDIEERRRVGIQRYGTELQAHNGRDMLRDAYEESMDLTIYLRGVLYERDGT